MAEAAYHVSMAVVLGQDAAAEAMRNQGPPQVGGTRMMTCGNTIGDNACKGKVSEQLYTIVHQSAGNSTYMYRCLVCGKHIDVKRVATASLPTELQPATAMKTAS
jgi:hypothetical protein